jgi:xanthine dehydrogenase YagS FAD-binding subunit
VRDRQVWDFALVSVASAMTTAGASGGSAIDRVRLAVGGVAARPLRLSAVEELVRGRPRNEATAEAAGELAIEGAQALRFNAYKVPLMRNLVKRAIRGVEAATWTS